MVLALGGPRRMAANVVCVLDCDVRQTSFAAALHADSRARANRSAGGGRVTDAQVIRVDPMTGMRFIAAGTPNANTLGLFMSEYAAAAAAARDARSCALLDAPPAQAMIDTRVIAHIADATLLCLRWHSTPLAIAEHALALLGEAGANVVGVALDAG